MALTIMWKNCMDANGSATITAVDGCWSNTLNLSRSISSPQRTCTIGSCESAGSKVNQIDGGFFFTHIPHINNLIFVLDSSVPMTLELTEVRCQCKACTTG